MASNGVFDANGWFVNVLNLSWYLGDFSLSLNENDLILKLEHRDNSLNSQ